MSQSSKLLLPVWLAFIVSLMATPAAASASGHAVHCKGVTVSSGVFHIDGVISDAESFRGALRVKATRTGRKPYFLPSGDLVLARGMVERRIVPGEVVIGNPSTPLPFDRKKDKGRWRSIPVEVKDVRFAGHYGGGLELGSGGCKVALSLTATGGADIGLVGDGTGTVNLQLVTCRNLTCIGGWVNSLINPPTSRLDSVEVPVENASQSPAEISALQIVLYRDVGEEVLSADAVTPPASAYVGPQHVKALPPIGIERAEIPPGHYDGAIYLTVVGAGRRALLPFELDVKDGPTLAVVVLVIALLAQLGVDWARRRLPRPTEVGEVDALAKKAKVALGDDARLLRPRLDEVREMAQSGQLEDSKVERQWIDAEIGRIEDAQALEQESRSVEGAIPADVSAAVDVFQTAVEKRTGTSEAELDALEETVRGYDEVAEADVANAVVSEPGDETRLPRWYSSGEMGARARRWLAWAAPWVLLIAVQVVLVLAYLLTGLKELYSANATFGAKLMDYGALFLWGLTAAGLNVGLDRIRRILERS